ncbi:MAG: alpha/beta fold hydrolase [Actinomycetales bacterium]|nr:alpha/beta fold hydrolase [Actinomycetales bacterium]
MKKFLVIVAAIAVVAAISVGLASLLRKDMPEAQGPTGEAAPAGLEKFYSQKVEWERCGQHTCAFIDVPVDYAKPEGETFKVKMQRVAANEKTDQVLFVNPGGPGGSGTQFARMVGSSVSEEMRDAYDVVGLDPRGVGGSTPLKCLTDKQFDASISLDPTPDTAEEIAENKAATIKMGEACLKNSGALAKNVDTQSAARDQDIARALLGQEKLHWYGASYGTQLGATYADLFPEKVGRMVLDGAVDTALDNVGMSKGQAEGFHRALVAYLESCIAEGDCPAGDTVDEGIASISGLLNGLDQKPMDVKGGRSLTESHGFFGVAVALYSKDSWPILTMALEKVFAGDPSMLMYLADAYFERQSDGSFANNSGQVISAISCLDSPGGLSAQEVQEIMPEFTKVSPVFGPFLAWGTSGCTHWPLESDTPQQPTTAKGAPEIVVVGTTRDSATPFEWAEALAEHLESGVLLTREGDGHTAYLMGNRCISDTIDAFYLNGTVPKNGTVCAEE